MSEDITYWRGLVRELTFEEFIEEYPYPFLLRKRMTRTLNRGQPGDFDDLAFKTDVVDLEVVPSRSVGRMTGAKVVAVVKSDRNPFAGQISVGRAKNCDIILRDASVSKNHAYFTGVERSSAELIDTDSQNCTRVNSKPIKPREPTRVESGDTIIFGSVITQFLDAAGLHRLL